MWCLWRSEGSLLFALSGPFEDSLVSFDLCVDFWLALICVWISLPFYISARKREGERKERNAGLGGGGVLVVVGVVWSWGWGGWG